MLNGGFKPQDDKNTTQSDCVQLFNINFKPNSTLWMLSWVKSASGRQLSNDCLASDPHCRAEIYLTRPQQTVNDCELFVSTLLISSR